MITKEFVEAYGIKANEYLNTIDEKYIDKWNAIVSEISFSESQLSFFKRDFLPMKIVVVSAGWCPDCQRAVSYLIKMDELCDFIDVIVIDRDKHQDELSDYITNGSLKVPLVLFMNESYQEIIRWIERPTIVYQIIYQAKKQAIEEGNTEYSDKIRGEFLTRKSEILIKIRTELCESLMKAVYLKNSASSLEELQHSFITI